MRNSDSVLVAVGRLEGRLGNLDDTLRSIQDQLREDGRARADLDKRVARLEQVYDDAVARMPEARREYTNEVLRKVEEQTDAIQAQFDARLRPFDAILSTGKGVWGAIAALVAVVGVGGLIQVGYFVFGLLHGSPVAPPSP